MGRIIDLANNINFDDIIATKGQSYKPDFQVFTAGIESDRHIKNRVNMIGSSTQEDLQGDSMSLLALNDMTKAAPNLTIWLNHDYSLPDSMFGSIVGTPTIQHQDGIADLHLAVDVEMDNPNAARTKQYIDKGRRLGCSIGCMVTKYEVPDEGDGDDWQSKGIIVHGVYVVEYSVVGIPANQRSWVENAIRGVFTRTLDPSLAPAMKALWPSSYKEAVKEVSTEKRKMLDNMPSRNKPENRINWSAGSRTFSLTNGGKEKKLTADELKSLFRGEDVVIADEVETPVVPAEDVEIPGLVDMSKSEDDITIKEATDRKLPDGTQSLVDGDNSNDPQDEQLKAENTDGDNHQPAPEMPGEEIKCDEGEPEVTKEAEPETEKELELPPHVQTLLSSYNTLGASLGFPEITPSMYAAAQHPALTKDTGDLSAEQGGQCQMIHDMVCSMTRGAVCANSSQSVQDATDQAAEASNNNPSISVVNNSFDPELLKKFDVLSKSIDAHHAATLDFAKTAGDIDLAKKELNKAREEISVLNAEIVATHATISALKDMPLGNPINHSRSTHHEDNSATLKDFENITGSHVAPAGFVAVDSLKEALELTKVKTVKMENGQFIRYRSWPSGVGGTVEKGVRPALTASHFQFMDFGSIQAYRAGEASDVPYIDNQVVAS